jgi:phage gpG-like protein
VTVEVVNLQEVIKYFESSGKGIEAAAVWALGQTAMAVNAQAKDNLSTYTNSAAPSGRNYKGHEGGEFPDQVTGTLKRRMYVEYSSPGMNTYEAVVGSGAVYGRKVELGGNGSRPFAYLMPAVRTVNPEALFMRKFYSKWKG